MSSNDALLTSIPFTISSAPNVYTGTELSVVSDILTLADLVPKTVIVYVHTYIPGQRAYQRINVINQTQWSWLK